MKLISFFLLSSCLTFPLIASPETPESNSEKNKTSDIHSIFQKIETKDARSETESANQALNQNIPFISGETKTSLFSQVIILGIIAIGGVILAIRFKQKGFAAFKIRKNDGKLKIAEIKDLGNRQFLVVVEYEANKILLGVTPGNISNLGPLVSPFSDPNFLNEETIPEKDENQH